MEDKILEKQILQAKKEVDSSLKDLAQSTVSEEMVYEYIFLFKEIVMMYEKYVDAMDDENYEEALIKASRIVTKIEAEKKIGILSFKKRLEELSPIGV